MTLFLMGAATGVIVTVICAFGLVWWLLREPS